MLDLVSIACPYCGEPIEVAVDASAGDARYIEDCSVCCRPIAIALTVDHDGSASVSAQRSD